MNNYAEYITPSEYKAIVENQDSRSLEELQALADKEGTCECCDEPIWKLGGCGMCFSCTTGESDASDDYELIPEIRQHE